MIPRVFVVAVMAGAALTPVIGQSGPPAAQATFRTLTDLVQVDAVVVDRGGQPVTGLTKSDFLLFDRNTEQVIEAFEEVSHSAGAAPLFPSTLKMDVADNSSARSTRLVVIGLDDFNLQGRTREVSDMARRLVERLGPEASLALVTTSGAFGVEPTEDRSLLLRELDRFLDRHDPERRRLSGGGPPPVRSIPGDADHNVRALNADLVMPTEVGVFYGGLTAYRTIQDAARKIGTDDSRRKAMIWISGGMPGPSLEECRGNVEDSDNGYCMAAARLMNQLRRSNVAAYGVSTSEFGSRTLDDMTGGSGGFTIDMDTFDEDLDRLINDLDHYYLLGFYPRNPGGRGERALEVRVNRPGAIVRARRGYEPGAAPKPPKNKDPLAKLSAEVLPKTDLPLRLSAVTVPAKGNKVDVILTLEVRSDDGPRLDAGTTAKEVLKYSVWAVDLRKKKPVAHVGREANVTFAPAEVEDEHAREVRYQVHTKLSLSPGRYQFRASASSAQLDRSGSVYFDMDVPDARIEPVTIGPAMIGYADGSRIFSLERPLVAGLLPFEPPLDRDFTTTDTLAVRSLVDGRDAGTCRPALSIARPGGVAVRSIEASLSAGAIDATVRLTDLLPGSYVLRVECRAAAVTREAGFIVK
jgi:VWFA-related protein